MLPVPQGDDAVFHAVFHREMTRRPSSRRVSCGDTGSVVRVGSGGMAVPCQFWFWIRAHGPQDGPWNAYHESHGRFVWLRPTTSPLPAGVPRHPGFSSSALRPAEAGGATGPAPS